MLKKLFYNQIQLFNLLEKQIDPEKQKEVEYLINNDIWDEDVTPEEFKMSMEASPRKEFLVNYSLDDIAKMKLFKLENYNIGFALKKRYDYKTGKYLSNEYDEALSLHNNEPDVSNLGKILMKAIIRNGGHYLDYFETKDDYLGKLYDELGFEEYKRHGLDLSWEGDQIIRNKYGDIDIVYRKYNPEKIKENEESDEIDFSHKDEGYVIINNEKYYIDDKYIRKDIMDRTILSVQERYDEGEFIDAGTEEQILERYLQNISIFHPISSILNEMIKDDDYKEIVNYIYEEKIKNSKIESILTDCVEFSLTEPNELYKFIDSEDSDYDMILEGWGNIKLEDILDSNLKDENETIYEIKIYDSYNKKTKEKYLTEAEVIYLKEEIAHTIGVDVREELDEYKETASCSNISFDIPYTVYQIINFETFKEKFIENYPDADTNILSRKKRIRGLIRPKGDIPYPSRRIYNKIRDFNINNSSIKKIITYLYNRDNDLTKKYNYKELNPLSKNIPLLKSGMVQPIKDGKTIVQLFPNGFTIPNLVELDSTLEKNTISDISIFRFLKNSDLIVEFTKWNSSQQRVFLKEDNHVFQLNIKYLEKEDEVFDYAEELYRNNLGENATWQIKKKVKEWQATTGHPVSREKITLAWIRFTKINEDEIVMDEIQTDLDNEDQYFGKELMDGWEDIILSKFIKFVKYNLHINKIYYPTYATKKNEYHANPPTYLYSELPKRYGFSTQSSNLEGFMLLEKKKTITN